LKKPFLLSAAASCVLSVILTILLISCSSPKQPEYRESRNFKVGKLGFSTSTLTTDLVFYNPNNFGMHLDKFDLDVFVDNNFLGHTKHEQLVSIPKKAEFAIPVKMDVDMKSLLKNGINAILSKDVVLKVVGTIRVGKGNISKSFPVNYETRQKLPLF
jgi:LEA14-like dessication related protein